MISLMDNTSGCKALDGCDRKDSCHRYNLAQQQTWMHGWSAYQLCRLSEFKDNLYLFYIEKNNEACD